MVYKLIQITSPTSYIHIIMCCNICAHTRESYGNTPVIQTGADNNTTLFIVNYVDGLLFLNSTQILRYSHLYKHVMSTYLF